MGQSLLHPARSSVHFSIFLEMRNTRQEALTWSQCYFLGRVVSKKAATTGKIFVQLVTDNAKTEKLNVKLFQLSSSS